MITMNDAFYQHFFHVHALFITYDISYILLNISIYLSIDFGLDMGYCECFKRRHTQYSNL